MLTRRSGGKRRGYEVRLQNGGLVPRHERRAGVPLLSWGRTWTTDGRRDAEAPGADAALRRSDPSALSACPRLRVPGGDAGAASDGGSRGRRSVAAGARRGSDLSERPKSPHAMN